MLETVREFAAERLTGTGLRDDAHERQDAWAVGLVRGEQALLFTADEIAAINALRAEENNLADVLRRALRDGDREVVGQVLACLGAFWTITGNHPRIFTIADAAETLLADWDPPEHLRTTAQLVASWLIVHLSWMPHRSVEALRAALARWGEPSHPWTRIAHAMFVDESEVATDQRVAALAEGADPVTAQMALLWAALIAEIDTLGEPTMGSQMVMLSARAELALARGEIADGLRLFDQALASVRPVEGLDLGDLNPWVLIAASASLVARVRHGTTDADAARARELVDVLATQDTGARADNALPYQDFPLNGVLLAAVGVWAVRLGGDAEREAGARLLAIADRWSYNRSFPTMAWEALQALAEQTAPGLLGEVTAEYADRPAADLLVEARELLERVTSSG
jgi:hypothetical protein